MPDLDAETSATATSVQIAELLMLKAAPAVYPDGSIVLSNAQARRLLALAHKGAAS